MQLMLAQLLQAIDRLLHSIYLTQMDGHAVGRGDRTAKRLVAVESCAHAKQ
jgi:hypothetical protein